MNSPTRDELAQRTIERLRRFNAKLESGEPIPCKVVRRHKTPDGPMHTFEESTLAEHLKEVAERKRQIEGE